MSLEDRAWNIEQCPRCNQCKANPLQASQKFAPLCPAIEYGQFHAYSGSGKAITSYALLNKRAEYTQEVLDSLTTCSLCGACDTACHFHLGDLVQPLEAIYEVRAKMFTEGQTPAAQRKLLDNIESHGNVHGRPRAERVRWAKGLKLKDATREPVEVLLHIGCANAFDEGQWPGLVGVVAALKASGVSFGTLGEQEIHAGALAYELGHRRLAQRCAEETLRLARASGASVVVTCDAESLAAFRNFYPRMGLTFDPIRVLHATEYLEELARHGQWGAAAAQEEVVTYHDPCRLGRLSEPYVPWNGKWTTVMNGMRVAVPPKPNRFGLGGVYDAPRQLLAKAPGTRLVEMERRREFSYCCGAGGGGKEAHPEFAEKAALDRLEEAVSTGATTLVTSCGGCTRHLSAVAEKHGVKIRVADLIGYLTKA